MKFTKIYLEGDEKTINMILEIARDKLGNGINMSVLDMKFKDNTFDVVHSVGVLHHTPNARKGFKECCRVLKKNGILIVALYNKNSPYPLMYKIGKYIPTPFLCIIYDLGLKTFGIDRNQKEIEALVQDQFRTPVANFFSIKEVKEWFKEENIDFKILTGTSYFSFLPKENRQLIYYVGRKR